MNATIEKHAVAKILLTSPAFRDGDIIPVKYAAIGRNIRPAFEIKGMPEDCKSLAMVMEDNNSSTGPRIHWLAWNLPVIPQLRENDKAGVCGKNDFGTNKFVGPMTTLWAHRYTFHVYGLDALLDISSTSGINELRHAMNEHLVAVGRMDVLFKN